MPRLPTVRVYAGRLDRRERERRQRSAAQQDPPGRHLSVRDQRQGDQGLALIHAERQLPGTAGSAGSRRGPP